MVAVRGSRRGRMVLAEVEAMLDIVVVAVAGCTEVVTIGAGEEEEVGKDLWAVTFAELSWND